MPWRLLVAGDGDARVEVGRPDGASGAERPISVRRTRWQCRVNDASDLCVGRGTSLRMAMLEAKAAGLPVVSCAPRGVTDVVEEAARSVDRAARGRLAGL